MVVDDLVDTVDMDVWDQDEQREGSDIADVHTAGTAVELRADLDIDLRTGSD